MEISAMNPATFLLTLALLLSVSANPVSLPNSKHIKNGDDQPASARTIDVVSNAHQADSKDLVIRGPGSLHKRHDYYLWCPDRAYYYMCSAPPYKYYCHANGALDSLVDLPPCDDQCECKKLCLVSPIVCSLQPVCAGVVLGEIKDVTTGETVAHYNLSANGTATNAITGQVIGHMSNGTMVLDEKTVCLRDVAKTISLPKSSHSKRRENQAQSQDVGLREPDSLSKRHDYFVWCGSKAGTTTCIAAPFKYYCNVKGKLMFEARATGCSNRCSCSGLCTADPAVCGFVSICVGLRPGTVSEVSTWAQVGHYNSNGTIFSNATGEVMGNISNGTIQLRASCTRDHMPQEVQDLWDQRELKMRDQLGAIGALDQFSSDITDKHSYLTGFESLDGPSTTPSVAVSTTDLAPAKRDDYILSKRHNYALDCSNGIGGLARICIGDPYKYYCNSNGRVIHGGTFENVGCQEYCVCVKLRGTCIQGLNIWDTVCSEVEEEKTIEQNATTASNTSTTEISLTTPTPTTPLAVSKRHTWALDCSSGGPWLTGDCSDSPHNYYCDATSKVRYTGRYRYENCDANCVCKQLFPSDSCFILFGLGGTCFKNKDAVAAELAAGNATILGLMNSTPTGTATAGGDVSALAPAASLADTYKYAIQCDTDALTMTCIHDPYRYYCSNDGERHVAGTNQSAECDAACQCREPVWFAPPSTKAAAELEA